MSDRHAPCAGAASYLWEGSGVCERGWHAHRLWPCRGLLFFWGVPERRGVDIQVVCGARAVRVIVEHVEVAVPSV